MKSLRLSILLLLLLMFPGQVLSQKLSDLEKVISRTNWAKTAAYVVESGTGKIVFKHNQHLSLKPASTMKVLTSAVAYETLGTEYRFGTDFLYENKNLYIRGGGDPDFNIEELWLAVRKLKRAGLKEIKDLVLDDYLFEDGFLRTGQRAYEAGSSALSFNFNSITFEVCPRQSGVRADISVVPAEAPVITVGSIVTGSRKSGGYGIDQDGYGPGVNPLVMYRLRGFIPAGRKCTEVYRSVAQPLVYAGAVAKSLLKQSAIGVKGEVRRGKAPDSARLIYTNQSKPLYQIIEDLNHYSNNFIANQLIMAVGETPKGAKSREAGLKRLTDKLEKLGFSSMSFEVQDGSGLSHRNRLSASMLVALLNDLDRKAGFSPEFRTSLSIPGQRGTLKKRTLSGGRGELRAKTGTLNGVTALTGYLTTKKNTKLSFAIIQNETKSTGAAHNIEKSFLDVLYHNY